MRLYLYEPPFPLQSIVESRAAYQPEISPDYCWRHKGEEVYVLSDAPSCSFHHTCAYVQIMRSLLQLLHCNTTWSARLWLNFMHVCLDSKNLSRWTLRITCLVSSSMCPPYCCWYCIQTLCFLMFSFVIDG